MKIYIAGKITGEPNYKEIFAEYESLLSKQEHVVLNPAKCPYTNLDYEDYMKIGFTLIDISDGIYLLPNWRFSKGAVRERYYALSHGKQIFEIKCASNSCEMC